MNTKHWIGIIAILSVALPICGQNVLPIAESDSLLVAPKLSLVDCLQMAQKENATLKNAALDVNMAVLRKNEAFSEYFPKISLSAYGFYSIDPLLEVTMDDVLGSSDMANNLKLQLENLAGIYGIDPKYTTLDYGYGATATILQPIYAGGRIANGNRLADVGIRAAKLKNSITQSKQEESIEDKYWRVVSLEEKLNTVEAALDYVNDIQHTVEFAHKAGLALDTDLLQVEKERNKLLSSQTRLLSGIRVAKMDLFNAIGQNYSLFNSAGLEDFPPIDSIELTDKLDSLVSPEQFYINEYQAASNSDEARLLDLSVEAAQIERKMAIGEALPSIGVGFGYGYGKLLGDPEWNGTAFATLNIPITQWWGKSQRAERLELKIQQAENNREYLQSQLVVKANMLWEEMTCDWREMAIALDTKNLSKTTYERMKVQYQAGQVTMSDLLRSNSEMQQAENDYTDAKIKYKLSLLKYQNFTRGGQASSGSPTVSH